MPKYWEPPEAGVGGPEPIAPIHGPEPREDKDLTEGVRQAFLLDPDLVAADFEIETHNGVVYLHGTVATENIKRHAAEVALAVEGVQEVRDHVVVKPG